MDTFINLSNHPSKNWGQQQIDAAELYGNIIDIPFPQINPDDESDTIDCLVEEYFDKVKEHHNPTVMIQGEFIFTFRFVSRLKREGIRAVAGCSKRKSIEFINEDGLAVKKSVFEFVRFREY